MINTTTDRDMVSTLVNLFEKNRVKMNYRDNNNSSTLTLNDLNIEIPEMSQNTSTYNSTIR